MRSGPRTDYGLLSRPLDSNSATEIGGGQAAPLVGGLRLDQLAFVRAFSHKPESSQDGFAELAPWEGREAIAILDRWMQIDGLDPASVLNNYNFQIRNSIHGSLNHHVVSHAYGNWDNAPYALISSLESLIKANGPPTLLTTVDTSWTLAPGKRLKMPEAVLVRPAESSELQQGLTGQSGNDVVYRAVFDDRSESLVRASPGFDEKRFSDELKSQLALPRNQRRDDLARLLDSAFAQISRDIAVNQYLTEAGYPLRPGGAWAWGDDWSVTSDTKKLAEFLSQGSSKAEIHVEQHSGSPEHTAIDHLSKGEPDLAKNISGLSPSTIEMIDHLEKMPSYQAFVRAVQAQRDISAFMAYQSGELIHPHSADYLTALIDRTDSTQTAFTFVGEGRNASNISIIAASAVYGDQNGLVERIGGLEQGMNCLRGNNRVMNRMVALEEGKALSLQQRIAFDRAWNRLEQGRQAIVRDITNSYWTALEQQGLIDTFIKLSAPQDLRPEHHEEPHFPQKTGMPHFVRDAGSSGAVFIMPMAG